jgi:exosortase H (IPTLxxWG-CTERM-specific)
MKRARFLVIFFLLLALFEVPLLLPAVDQNVIMPINGALTSAAGAALRLLGEKVNLTGTMISGSCFAVDLKNGCNGIEATLFLVAAVLAFPAAARERVLAAIAGAALIQVVNFIRIMSLYLLGCYRRSWFDAFHLAVWQSIIFALAVGVFMVWTRRVTAAHAR